MPTPTIPNVGQAFNVGGSWLNTYLSNQNSQESVDFQNNSGTVLYVGDVVVLSNIVSSTTPDPTALSAAPIASASSTYVVGVVGGEVYNPGATTSPAQVGGALIPLTDTGWVYSTGTWTSGTATITDSTASASNIGKAVYGQDSPNSWPITPGLQSIVISAVANTSYGVSIAPTQTRGSATNYYLGPAEGAVGPQFPGISGYGAGDIMPVVTRGWAYINIGTNTVAAGAALATSATSRVAAVPGTAGSVAALQALLGSFIGIALEAQSAGIGSPDGTTNKLIRAWIDKF
jgi:hypothetical protein